MAIGLLRTTPDEERPRRYGTALSPTWKGGIAVMMTFKEWISELERLRGKPIGCDPEEYRAIYNAGEEPQTVIDEWGVEPTFH